MDTGETNGKYEYMSLAEIYSQVVRTKSYVNIYGIVNRISSESTVYLDDENVEGFAFQLSNDGTKSVPFKTGDIVRVHRLLLTPNQLKRICINHQSILVFEAFKDRETVEPVTSAKAYTLEEYDITRRIELEEWYSNKLMKNTLESMPDVANVLEPCYYNIVGQIISLTMIGDRAILCLWDGTRPSIKISEPTVSSNEPRKLIDEDLSTFTVNKQVFVQAFEDHAVESRKLTPGCYVALFNVKVDHKVNYGRYTLTLSRGNAFGRCIRLVDNASILGNKLGKRIEEALADYVDCSSLSHSSLWSNDRTHNSPEVSDSNNNSTPVSVNSADITTRTSHDSNDGNFLQSTPTKSDDIRVICIADLIECINEEDRFAIKAKAIEYSPTLDVYDIVSVWCPTCYHKGTLNAILGNAKQTFINSLDGVTDCKSIQRVTCPKCDKLSPMNFIFDIEFMLEDEFGDRLKTKLSGSYADRMFGWNPKEVLISDGRLAEVRKTIEIICPPLEKKSCTSGIKNPLYLWIVMPKQTGQSQFVYRLVSVERFTKDAMVGCNLSGLIVSP